MIVLSLCSLVTTVIPLGVREIAMRHKETIFFIFIVPRLASIFTLPCKDYKEA